MFQMTLLCCVRRSAKGELGCHLPCATCTCAQRLVNEALRSGVEEPCELPACPRSAPPGLRCCVYCVILLRPGSRAAWQTRGSSRRL
ncbi:unnamed protein product [Lampetra planeri]